MLSSFGMKGLNKMFARIKVQVRWQHSVVLRFVFALVCAHVFFSCEKQNKKRLTDWEQYAVLSTECEVKLSSMGSCEEGTPAEIQRCWIARKTASYIESTCRDSEAQLEKLLVAKDPKALILFNKKCRNSNSDLDKICNSKSFEGYSERWRRVGEKIKQESEEEIANLISFEKRDPGGFLQAKWGASIENVANEIISNLKPMLIDEDWTKIRQAAAGRSSKDQLQLSFMDRDRTFWFFNFNSDGFYSYNKIHSASRAADILVGCRESFGAPTKETKNADGKNKLLWMGPKTVIICGIDSDGEASVIVGSEVYDKPDKEKSDRTKTTLKKEQH